MDKHGDTCYTREPIVKLKRERRLKIMYQGKFTIGNIYSYYSKAKGDKVYTYLGLSDQGRHRIKFTDDSYNEVHQTEGGLRDVTVGDLGKPASVVEPLAAKATTWFDARVNVVIASGKGSSAAEPVKPKEEPKGFTGVFKPGAKYARVIRPRLPDLPELTYVGSLGACHVVAKEDGSVGTSSDEYLRSTVTHEIVPKVETVEYRNVYQNSADGKLYFMNYTGHATRSSADSLATSDRVGCQKITLTKGHYDD
jgi:hypothetical protein